MSSDPKEPPQSNRLPFEPGQSRKKANASDTAAKSVKAKQAAAKDAPKSPAQPQSGSPAAKSASKTQAATARQTKAQPPEPDAGAIPAVVSQRMGRRMAFFSGIPTGLGVLTFLVSYLIVTQGWFKLPNVAVLLVSMGWFGLGVVGLSYGALSASWDEERVGTRLGSAEFKTNFGRLTEAWKSRPKA
jgi:VIT1/CCC1 family predicted Fe2+/Mn2+ transporter